MDKRFVIEALSLAYNIPKERVEKKYEQLEGHVDYARRELMKEAVINLLDRNLF